MMKYAVLSTGRFRAPIDKTMYVHAQLIAGRVRKTAKSNY
jgi:hypothetical protein